MKHTADTACIGKQFTMSEENKKKKNLSALGKKRKVICRVTPLPLMSLISRESQDL
jgi:hypothetical protein